MIFGTYKLHNAENEMMLKLSCQLLFARGRYKHEYSALHLSAYRIIA